MAADVFGLIDVFFRFWGQTSVTADNGTKNTMNTLLELISPKSGHTCTWAFKVQGHSSWRQPVEFNLVFVVTNG